MTRQRRDKRHTRVGKMLARVLRHEPEAVGLTLDPEGWVATDALIAALNEHQSLGLDQAELEQVVATDSKGRYTLRDGRIRAAQGHSVKVAAVDLTPRRPPDVLFHGTNHKSWSSIRDSGGLRPMKRHHVHLSATRGAALEVGRRRRRSELCLLQIDAAGMVAAGFEFYLSDNGVWLTDAVPVRWISVAPDETPDETPGPTPDETAAL